MPEQVMGGSDAHHGRGPRHVIVSSMLRVIQRLARRLKKGIRLWGDKSVYAIGPNRTHVRPVKQRAAICLRGAT